MRLLHHPAARLAQDIASAARLRIRREQAAHVRRTVDAHLQRHTLRGRLSAALDVLARYWQGAVALIALGAAAGLALAWLVRG